MPQQIFDLTTINSGPPIKVRTRQCLLCKETSILKLDSSAYSQYANGMYVQDAFPKMLPEYRELLITGTHSVCWKKLFPDDEEEG